MGSNPIGTTALLFFFLPPLHPPASPLRQAHVLVTRARRPLRDRQDSSTLLLFLVWLFAQTYGLGTATEQQKLEQRLPESIQKMERGFVLLEKRKMMLELPSTDVHGVETWNVGKRMSTRLFMDVLF